MYGWYVNSFYSYFILTQLHGMTWLKQLHFAVSCCISWQRSCYHISDMWFRFPKQNNRQYTSYIKVYPLIPGHSLAAAISWCEPLYPTNVMLFKSVWYTILLFFNCYAMIYPPDNEHPRVVLKSFPFKCTIPFLLFFCPGDPEEFRPVFLRLRHQHPCVGHRREVAWDHSGTRGETGSFPREELVVRILGEGKHLIIETETWNRSYNATMMKDGIPATSWKTKWHK